MSYMYSRSQIKVNILSSYNDHSTKRSYLSFHPFKQYAAILFKLHMHKSQRYAKMALLTDIRVP